MDQSLEALKLPPLEFLSGSFRIIHSVTPKLSVIHHIGYLRRVQPCRRSYWCQALHIMNKKGTRTSTCEHSHCWTRLRLVFRSFMSWVKILICKIFDGVISFGLILYVPLDNFSVMLGRVFLGLTSTKQRIKCLAQGHNRVSPVRLEPATAWSGVKHSTIMLLWMSDYQVITFSILHSAM